MCQVHVPGKTDYTACHRKKTTTTYILHVVPITTSTHTHDRRKSIGKKKHKKGKMKEKKDNKAKNEKEKEVKEKTRKGRKDKTRRGSKEGREKTSY